MEEKKWRARVCHAQGWTVYYRSGERERESLRKSPREVLREPTMDPLYCYAVAARMPPSRPLSRYADPMRVYTRFLLLFLRSFRPLSSEPSRSPVAVAHLLTRPVIKIDIVRSAIEKEGIKNARNCFQLCFDLSSIISTSPISSYFVILSFCNKIFRRGKFVQSVDSYAWNFNVRETRLLRRVTGYYFLSNFLYRRLTNATGTREVRSSYF